MRYLYPCKPNSLDVESELFTKLNNDPNWIAEVKRNGIRTMHYTWLDGRKEIWTRAKTIVKDELTDVRRQFETLPSGTILDGELINHRPKNWEKHFYLFDVIMFQGKLLVDLTLIERRKILEEIYNKYLRWGKKIILSQWCTIGKKKLYQDSIGDDLLEGIVVKRLDSKHMVSITKCLQNPMWLKVKKPDSMFAKAK